MNANLIEKFKNTSMADNNKSKDLLGKILKNAFDKIKSDALDSENILFLAWKFQVPQFDEMFQDHQNHDYSHFNNN